jgi:membrane associated rhomboid family serine protease
MLLPLRDDQLQLRPPAVTIGIIGACTLIFLYQMGLNPRQQQILALGYGLIPSVLLGTNDLAPSIPTVEPWLTVFTSMFLHGGVLHLVGNMIYLWVFGRSIEGALGHGRFLVFYVLSGVAAAMAQTFMEAGSELPMVGASGAISGVLGAYFLLFPRARVRVLFFYFLITTINLPAKALLAWWIVVQLGSILLGDQEQGGVAFYAHIGGFIAGMAMVPFFRPWRAAVERRGPWG